jgi:hypothetical protein
MISERTGEAQDRAVPGYWEVDRSSVRLDPQSARWCNNQSDSLCLPTERSTWLTAQRDSDATAARAVSIIDLGSSQELFNHARFPVESGVKVYLHQVPLDFGRKIGGWLS